MKLVAGGLVDIEFCAQYLQLIHAGEGGPLRQNTAKALNALEQGAFAPHPTLEALRLAWELHQDLSQLLKVAIDDDADPTLEPAALRSLLTKTGDARRFADLKATLARARRAAHRAFREVLLASGDGGEPLVR